jgi:hypothetical protein
MTAAVWLNQNLGELVFLFWVGGTDIAGTGRQVIAAVMLLVLAVLSLVNAENRRARSVRERGDACIQRSQGAPAEACRLISRTSTNGMKHPRQAANFPM